LATVAEHNRALRWLAGMDALRDDGRAMPFPLYFDPADTDPVLHVDREPQVAWLRNNLDAYLGGPDKSKGRALAILGERGVGKSILARKVLDELRELHTATTLFIQVDCRNHRNQRKVYQDIAAQAVKRLGERTDVDEAMLATARLLHALSTMDTVKQSVLYERLIVFKQAAKLGGGRKLLSLLGLNYEINIERSVKHAESVEGSIHFDDLALRDMTVAFFEDLRTHQNLDSILLLDNLDELDHEALVEESRRESLQSEIDELLGLTKAPIGLVLTIRTYFAIKLTRWIDANRTLNRLAAADHTAIIALRAARESPQIRAQIERAASAPRVSERAPTPFALLRWFRYLLENERHDQADIEASLRGILVDQYASMRPETIERIVAAFDDPDQAIGEDAVLAACGNNRILFKQVLRYQIVLPVDFWYPIEFTLCPELHFLWKPRPA
jgi:hypothetical protein